MGIYNTAAEIEYLVEHLPGIIDTLRANAPLEDVPVS
jgi:hypothetical protein